MTEKELRYLSRAELLELLLYQMEENEKLKRRLKRANRLLESRDILLEEAGSIAEAALRLNGVFEAAQEAADHYLDNIKRLEQQAYSRYEETDWPELEGLVFLEDAPVEKKVSDKKKVSTGKKASDKKKRNGLNEKKKTIFRKKRSSGRAGKRRA